MGSMTEPRKPWRRGIAGNKLILGVEVHRTLLRRWWSISELAAEFRVHERTVGRWLAAFRDAGMLDRMVDPYCPLSTTVLWKATREGANARDWGRR